MPNAISIGTLSRAWIIALGLPLVIALALVLTYLIVVGRLTSRIDAFVSAARAEGLPMSATELNAYYDFGPVAEQAGERLKSVLKRIAVVSESEEVIGFTKASYELGEPIPADVLDGSRRYHAKQEATLEELRALLPAPLHVRYPTDLSLGAEAPLEHLAWIRSGTRLLSLDAVLAAIDGDSARVQRSVGQAFALAETLRDEPLIISQLVRVHCHDVVVQALQECLNRGTIAPDVMKRLQDILSRVDMSGAVARGLVGERAWIFGDMSEGEDKRAELEAHLAQAGTTSDFSMFYMRFRLYRLYEVANLMADFDELIAVGQLPPVERLARADNMIDTIASRKSFGNLYSQLILSVLFRSYNAECRVTANLNSARVGIAVARYQSARGALPASLDDLVPEYFARVPVDPFSVEALRYRRTNRGFVVYSLGPNLVDDGGRPPAAGMGLNGDGDVAFEILRARN